MAPISNVRVKIVDEKSLKDIEENFEKKWNFEGRKKENSKKISEKTLKGNF